MINIVRNEKYVIVDGHSRSKYAPKTDESIQACAAVTAITQTLLFGVLRVERETEAGDEPYYRLEKGLFILETEFVSELSLLLIDVFMMGAEGLAGAYPEYINLIK